METGGLSTLGRIKLLDRGGSHGSDTAHLSHVCILPRYVPVLSNSLSLTCSLSHRHSWTATVWMRMRNTSVPIVLPRPFALERPLASKCLPSWFVQTAQSPSSLARRARGSPRRQAPPDPGAGACSPPPMSFFLLLPSPGHLGPRPRL